MRESTKPRPNLFSPMPSVRIVLTFVFLCGTMVASSQPDMDEMICSLTIQSRCSGRNLYQYERIRYEPE